MTETKKSDPWIDHKLRVMLAEYNSLRSDIKSKSEFQSRLLQIHITVLTTIIGAILYKNAQLWLLFLIPIESLLFGSWYRNYASSILGIETYIRKEIESKVKEMLGDRYLMGWEHAKMVDVIPYATYRENSFWSLVQLTFLGPSILISLFALILLIQRLLVYTAWEVIEVSILFVFIPFLFCLGWFILFPSSKSDEKKEFESKLKFGLFWLSIFLLLCGVSSIVIIKTLISIREQLLIHKEWMVIQLYLLFIFSFVLVGLGWFGFYSINNAYGKIRFECNEELEREFLKK
jgi:hypothetical protein